MAVQGSLFWAALGAAGVAELEDTRPQVLLGDASLCGVDVALAIVADPFGDPSRALRAAFERFGGEARDEAEEVRRERREYPAS